MSERRRRPGLIAIWAVLGLLIGAIVVLEGPNLIAPSPSEPTESARLFQFNESDLGGVQVVYERQIASLMRGPGGLWYQHDDSHSHGGAGAAQAPAGSDTKHASDPAQSAMIAERLARVADMSANRQGLDGRGREANGLAKSETMIAFYGRGAEGVDYTKPMDVLHIGDLQPETDAFYARLEGDPDVTLIKRDDLFSLLEVVFGAGQVPSPAEN